MKKIVQTLALMALSLSAQAELPMTLEQVQRYAVENNIDLQIEQESNASTRQDRVEAVASLFPSLCASSSIYNSYGRSIDPETNTYTTVGNVSNSYSVSSSLTVFAGLRNINAVKVSRMKIEMGAQTFQQKKDAVEINVMRLFYDVLYYAQSIEIVQEQKTAAEKVLELTTKQEELGIKSVADVALSASQVANYNLLLTQQENQYSQALLNLKEAMNFPFDHELVLSDETSTATAATTAATTAAIFSIEANPEYQSALWQVDICRTNLKIARGNYAPTLSVGVGYNNYYYASFAEGYTATTFGEQLKTNYGYYVGASLSIPIFNNLSYRCSVARSGHTLRTAELELHKTEMRITKAATEALLQRNSYHREQISAAAKVEATAIATQAMLRKFEQGVASVIELQTCNNDLLSAKSEELSAKFNYQIQCVMVDYYNGKELIK